MPFTVPVKVSRRGLEGKYDGPDDDDSSSVNRAALAAQTAAVTQLVASDARNRGEKRSLDGGEMRDPRDAVRSRGAIPQRPTEGRTLGDPGGVFLLPTGPSPADMLGPGGTAGRGTQGLPGNNYVVSRNKPIRSHHRTSTTPYQVSVAMNCEVPRPEVLYNERKALAARLAPEELLAPLGTVNCFKAHKGELVYQVQDGNGAPIRDVSAYDGYPRVFSCVNGLSASTRLMFAGYMAFNQNAEHPDPVGTLVVAGTVTVTHCGPFPIKSLQVVYFSKYPYVRVSDNGLLEPAIREVGIPGASGETDITSGESLAKFKPALYALNDQDTAACIKAAEKLIREEVEAKKDELKNSGGASFASIVGQIVQRVYSQRFITDARDLPVVRYAEIYTWACAFELVECQGDDREKEAAREFFDKIREHYRELSHYSASLKDALGSNLIGYTHPSLRPGVVDEVSQEEYFPSAPGGASVGSSGSSSSSVRTVALPAKTWSASGRRLGQVLLTWARDLCNFHFADQEDWLRAHVVGTAMKDCVSGRDLDLMLGYFFR
jgi:hypothetical protein